MAADRETKEKVLAAVPQKEPFRFIDEILELDAEHIVGAYRVRENEYFYKGHFPDRPITPGVILVEAMAQTGLSPSGSTSSWNRAGRGAGKEKLTTLFTVIDVMEFTGIVRPGEKVVIRGEKIYFRKGNLKAKVSMERENGETVCSGVLAGMGVNLHGSEHQ
jgi:3-hydroxyacyl-[acyl-carrier-protein] dehydratase